MSSSGTPDGIKARTLRALSGRGGPQRRLKVGSGVFLVGIVVMLGASLWVGLIVSALGLVAGGVLTPKRR